MFGLSSQLHISTTFAKTVDPTADTTQNSHMGTRVWHSLSSFYCSSCHHKTQQLISRLCTPQNPFRITQKETGSLPLPALFLHEFFLFLIAHIFPLPYYKFQIFFFSYPQTKNHIYNGKLRTHHGQHHQWPQNEEKKIQPSATATKRKKISNHQYHHQPHKPTSIIAQASNHNYKHRKPKHTNTKSSDRWSKIANSNP